MFKRGYIRRPGKGDDTVFERQPIFLWWIPNFLRLGFYPYANSLSAANRHVQNLNKMAKDMLDEVDKYAAALAEGKKDRDRMDSMPSNRYGISKIEYLSYGDIKDMLPFTDKPDEFFKKVIIPNVINQALVRYKVEPTKNSRDKKKNNSKADLMITTSGGASSVSHDDAHHVEEWRQQNRKRASGKHQNISKKRLNEIKEENPRDDREDRKDWNERIQEIVDDE